MKNFLLITVLTLSASFVACQKQQSDEARKADVERQVQERLAAEHQQQQAQELAQREARLTAREQALKEKRDVEAAAPAPMAPGPQTAPETKTEGSYSTFYTRLEPYGDWIETDDYGYVYRPREAENSRWRPYTNGQWVYTDAGWTWVSDEPFGWATYHYGRWTRIRGTGWVWVPGNEWAPAWVSWRKGGQYVGWAPLPPEAHFDRASGIRNWSDSYYDVGPDQYVFVPTTDLGEQRIAAVIVPEQQNVTIVNQTTNITNITYNNTVIVNEGPNYDELRKQSRVPIQRLRLQRETVVSAQNARAVVRGDSVVIPAPVIATSQNIERPRAVKQTIKQATIDRGWNAISNQRDAEQARAKIKSEATPPPNAPQKKFVKPAVPPDASSPPTANTPPIPEPARSVQSRSTPPPVTTKPPRPAAPSPSRPPTAIEKASPFQVSPAPPTTTSPTSPAARPNVPPRPPTRTSPSGSPAHSPSIENSPATPEAGATASAPPQTNAPNQSSHRGEKKKNLPRRERPGEPLASPSASPE